MVRQASKESKANVPIYILMEEDPIDIFMEEDPNVFLMTSILPWIELVHEMVSLEMRHISSRQDTCGLQLYKLQFTVKRGTE